MIWSSGVQCQGWLAFELQEWVGHCDLLQSTPTQSSNNTDVLEFHHPSALSRNSTTDGLNSRDKLYSTTDHLGGLVTHDKLATAMAVMMLTPNFFPSCLVQPHHQDANPVGVCWNVQLSLDHSYFNSRASVLSYSREPGQSWKPALTGSLFQLIWLFNPPHSRAQWLSHNFY